MTGGHAHRRSGMTLLEVVLATVLLALVASSVTAVISRLNAAQIRNQKTIGAYEVANRLMLQHLDDPKVMRGKEEAPIEYDRFRYKWDLTEARATMELVSQGDASSANLGLSRFKIATVRVYDIRERASLGAITVRGEQLASVARLYDPFTPRNPDAVARWTSEDVMVSLRELIGDGLSDGEHR